MADPIYTDKDLYGTSGRPEPADISQGNLGDCYFISPLGALAGRQPERIENAISYNADKGTFNVTLYKEAHSGLFGLHHEPKPVQIEVTQADIAKDKQVGIDSNLPVNQRAKEPLWPSVMEAAYAKMSEHSKETINDGLNRIGGGGYPANAMYALTGERDQSVSASKLDKMGIDAAYTELSGAIKEGRPMLLSTNPTKDMPTDGLVKGDKNSGHAYMLEGVSKDQAGNVMLTLRNPWGNNYDPSQGVSSPDPLVTVNLKDIIKNGHLESIDIGPAASKKLEKAQPEPQKHADKLPVQTGDSHIDKLFATMHNPTAFRQAMTELTNSPNGEVIRAETRAQHAELQNQQSQTPSIQPQTQTQAPAPTGPAITR